MKRLLIDDSAFAQSKRRHTLDVTSSSSPRSLCSFQSSEEASGLSAQSSASNASEDSPPNEHECLTIDDTECHTPYSRCQLDHSSTEMRIFTLLPASDRNTPLAGHLRVVNLEPTAPRYEALSYAWGYPGRTSCLRVDNSSLEIGANLFVALINLRHKQEPRDIWIDAICIDQASPLEKNHQVRQMYKIYSLAWRILIWLGDSDEASDYAFKRIRESSTRTRFYEEEALGSSDSQFWLDNIFARPWWQRVWTLQEGLAAGPYTRVICGSDSVGWQVILDNAHNGVSSTAMEASGIADFIRTCKRHQSRPPTLEDLFWSSTSREATDPRDYIYGLLGPVNSGMGAGLLPDYTKPATWAYQKAMIAIMAEASNLDFLFVRVLQKDSRRPSWCLDFSKTDGLSQLRAKVRSLTQLGPQSNAAVCAPKSSCNPTHLFKHDICKGTISLIGKRIDKIVVTCLRDKETHPCFLSNLDFLHQECVHNCRLSYFANTYSLKLQELYPHGKVFAKAHGTRSQNIRQFKWRYDKWMSDSRWLFGTVGGRIGYASTSLRDKDIICEVYGSLFPLALRPQKDGTYSVIGIIAALAMWTGSSSRADWEFVISAGYRGSMVERLGSASLEEGDEEFVIS